ncbi:MAG TPA: hypothetical protein VE996_02130 [Terriglobales bacterium]|nr:hypothetical protein [Terriglobales bacterium]
MSELAQDAVFSVGLLGAFLIAAVSYDRAIMGPATGRGNYWRRRGPVIFGFWLPTAAIAELGVALAAAAPRTWRWHVAAIVTALCIWGGLLWLRYSIIQRRRRARGEAPPRPLWQRVSAESWLTLAWIVALAASLIEWNVYVDGAGRLAFALLWTAAAGGAAAWPGARRARAAAGLKVVLVLGVIGLIVQPALGAALAVAGLGVALFLLTRQSGAAYQDLAEINDSAPSVTHGESRKR